MLRLLTVEEVLEEALRRFGDPDPLCWQFRCPRCGDVAAVAEFPPGDRHRAGTECIGRLRADRGCSWGCDLVGGPWAVLSPSGRAVTTFAFPPPQRPVTVIEGALAS